MKTIRAIFTTLVNIISKPAYFFSGLASIIGVVFFITKEDWAVYIALIFFCIIITIFVSYLIYALFKILDVHIAEHENRSTFIKYENLDGNQIIYETYKLIQCKKAIMNEFEYNFKWTGSHLPKITSNLQTVENVVDEKIATKYDKALLILKKPIYYNQNCVIHFKAELDDTDKQSQSYLETRVVNETSIIHYRIILRNKCNDFNDNAILERKKINSDTNNAFEKIKEIPYDSLTKSYEYHLLMPQVGYFYRVSWNK